MNLKDFETAVVQHRDRVFGFALHFLGNRQEAEDITQDVLIRLWSNRDSVDQSTLAAWLLRVARNACVDQYRKRKIRSQGVDPISPDHDTIAAAGEIMPDTEIDNRMLTDQVMKSVDALREPYKSIVILREMQDLTYEEISAALELPLSTVKVYLHRGRRAVRESIRQIYGDLELAADGAGR
ncbi:MAG: RNA polymerase sigma factor [Bacteroidetes bacterium]|nr:RNA polymerase sigma factor [Bacteroidota bacterium]